jgi:hypothetical protein
MYANKPDGESSKGVPGGKKTFQVSRGQGNTGKKRYEKNITYYIISETYHSRFIPKCVAEVSQIKNMFYKNY